MQNYTWHEITYVQCQCWYCFLGWRRVAIAAGGAVVAPTTATRGAPRRGWTGVAPSESLPSRAARRLRHAAARAAGEAWAWICRRRKRACGREPRRRRDRSHSASTERTAIDTARDSRAVAECVAEQFAGGSVVRRCVQVVGKRHGRSTHLLGSGPDTVPAGAGGGLAAPTSRRGPLPCANFLFGVRDQGVLLQVHSPELCPSPGLAGGSFPMSFFLRRIVFEQRGSPLNRQWELAEADDRFSSRSRSCFAGLFRLSTHCTEGAAFMV